LSTLLPYTTLFRSVPEGSGDEAHCARGGDRCDGRGGSGRFRPTQGHEAGGGLRRRSQRASGKTDGACGGDHPGGQRDGRIEGEGLRGCGRSSRPVSVRSRDPPGIYLVTAPTSLSRDVDNDLISKEFNGSRRTQQATAHCGVKSPTAAPSVGPRISLIRNARATATTASTAAARNAKRNPMTTAAAQADKSGPRGAGSTGPP